MIFFWKKLVFFRNVWKIPSNCSCRSKINKNNFFNGQTRGIQNIVYTSMMESEYYNIIFTHISLKEDFWMNFFCLKEFLWIFNEFMINISELFKSLWKISSNFFCENQINKNRFFLKRANKRYSKFSVDLYRQIIISIIMKYLLIFPRKGILHMIFFWGNT